MYPDMVKVAWKPFPVIRGGLQEAVFKAIEAGADGLLASSEYDEIRHSDLKDFGEAVRQIT